MKDELGDVEPAPRPPQPRVTFAAAVRGGVRKSFQARDRASRSEFWLFALFYGALICALLIFLVAIPENLHWLGILVYAAGANAGLIPFIAVGIRRLHDTGRSGFWCLLLPTCFFFIVLVFWVEPSRPHANQYGP
ncbi:DUF805 domain-containing protein [Saccharopolyspora sp. NPDC047091]|uniref:DUF805 domain-containing protein n=1 Tax=Saccharopolyspora sp. NPDC047091 TaxID=3155924 RepID=UPI003403955A